MLNSVRIQGFRSYLDATLHLSPLTLLVGANASGKSNAIEALRLLSWISRGDRLNNIRFAVQDDDQAVRGRVKDLPYQGLDRFTLTCNGKFGTRGKNWSDFSISLKASEDNELKIVDECITGGTSTVPLYAVVDGPKEGGSDITVAYDNFARGGKKPKIQCTDQQAVFIQLESPARFAAGHRESARRIPQVSSHLRRLLGGMQFLDPSPRLMRGYSDMSDRSLTPSGSTLSSVLADLCFSENLEGELLAFVESLPEQSITGIDFIETPRGEFMVQLVENFGTSETKIDATLLSDGTLRVLAIAALLLSSPKGSFVIIEEIDNGIHPSRAGQLLARISQIAESRNLRVLISSHNPALLNALPYEALDDVVFAYRDATDGSSKLQRLGNLVRYPELVARGELGDLLTEGIVDAFVKGKAGGVTDKEQTVDWLAKLAS